MKNLVISFFFLLLILSCGKEKKNEAIEHTETKTIEKVIDKSNVSIDSDGVANVLINTNDVMKFSIKSFTVKEGQKVKLTLKHTGKLDKRVMGHNVVILKKGVKVSTFASEAAVSQDNDYIPEGTTKVLAFTKMIGGGEATTIEFEAPELGSYDFICSFPSHFAMMKGKMIVE